MKQSNQLIYKGTYLTISYIQSKSLFIQNWVETTLMDLKSFQNEMLNYTKLYKEYAPQNTLWNHANFKFELTPKDYEWIEINVNIPCKKFGNKKCAFVVGKDVMAHLSVMDSFDEAQSCIVPKHFGSSDDAMDWIVNKNEDISSEFKAKFNGRTKKGLNEFTIQTASSDIKDVLKVINRVKRKNEFINSNIENFLMLTPRELEVFKRYSTGEQLKNIANDLHVSEYTVRTHWRNIKRKLEIKSFTDVEAYSNAFIK